MAANQNWMLGQADNGWMYFANNHGLLEFDGVFWNTYPIENDTKLRSLKITNQRIYVGGLGQFGYFEPDNYGRLQYTCLSKEMEKEGIIARTRGKQDARQTIVSLTGKGKGLQKQLADVPFKVGGSVICESLNPETSPELFRMLDDIIAKLSAR